MSFSALARLWLRRTSQQLRAASSTSSSAGGPPPLPVGSAPPSPSTSSSPPPLPGVSTPLAAQAPPPLSVRPMPGIQARPNPPAAAKSTVKVVFEAPASTPPIKAVTPTSDKPWKVHSIGLEVVPRKPSRLPAPRLTLSERRKLLRVAEAAAAVPPRPLSVEKPTKTRCAVFIDSENLTTQGEDGDETIADEAIRTICDYAKQQGPVGLIQAYEDVSYMRGASFGWRKNRDLMVAALAKHDVQIRDFQKVVSGDGNDADYLLTSDMLRFAYDNPGCTLILASGDGDFSYVVEQLASRGHPIHLLIPVLNGSAKLSRLSWRPNIVTVPIARLDPDAASEPVPGKIAARQRNSAEAAGVIEDDGDGVGGGGRGSDRRSGRGQLALDHVDSTM